MTITEKFERFQNFNFETNFLKNENQFQKTGVPFLVESTRIEKATFSRKTVQSDSFSVLNVFCTFNLRPVSTGKGRSFHSN